jgi:hypothetical protein
MAEETTARQRQAVAAKTTTGDLLLTADVTEANEMTIADNEEAETAEMDGILETDLRQAALLEEMLNRHIDLQESLKGETHRRRARTRNSKMCQLLVPMQIMKLKKRKTMKPLWLLC